MRSDFAKIIADCYKWTEKHSMSNEEFRNKLKQSKNDPDGEYYSTSFSAAHYRKRSFDWDYNERRMNPKVLVRYLKKQVGKKWDKTYSEIKKHCRHAQYVINAVHYLVTLDSDLEVVDGEVQSKTCSQWTDRRWIYTDFYVHPETGLLCETPKQEKYKYPQRPVTKYWMNDHTELLENVDGIWYYYKFVESEESYLEDYYSEYREEWCTRWVQPYNYCRWQQRKVTGSYAICKKQLNHRELESFGLRNDKDVA